MILIPAIDIKNNNCVRLKRGDINKSHVFSKNFFTIINKWINSNIKRLHLVDLDGALLGKPKNLITIKNIIKYLNNSVDIQLGGGIRNIETIDYYLNIGISYIILGTKAIIDLKFLKNVCELYKEKIILALDIKNLKLAINGWKNYYNLNLYKFLKEINNYPLNSIIYTDINRDGMLKGVNLENFFKIFNFLNKSIIISGGLSSTKDIKNIFLAQKNNLFGVICGTSIYEGFLNIKNINNKINYFNKIYIS